MPKEQPGFDIGTLASQLERARTAGGFSAFEYDEVASILVSAAGWPADIPVGELPNVVHTAISDAASRGPIRGKTLNDALRRAQHAFLNSPLKPYVLVTPVSLSKDAFAKARRLDGVSLSSGLRKAFKAARASDEAHIPTADVCPTDAIWAKVTVQGRTEHEGFEKALNKLDYVRACWNFYLNRKVARRISFPAETGPLNKITLGRCQSLHLPTGELAAEGHWTEPWLLPSKIFRPSARDKEGMLAFLRSANRKLRRHPYGEVLRGSLVRYVRALDSSDYEAVFLKLWSLTELLTNSGANNYDVTIRRIQFLYADRELTKLTLQHLRTQRNQSVHANQLRADARSLVYQAKGYIETLIDFHAALGPKLKSIEAVAQLMDLPADVDLLRARMSLHRRAIRFHS